jgi:thiol:disulfide interchange protein DsbD
MGLVAGLTGSLFGTVASNPWVRVGTAALLALFGLAMLGLVPVRAPARITTWVGGLRGGSYPAVLLLGATSGIVAAPCGAPAFATVLTWVAGTGSPALGFVYLFVFSLGMSALLVVVGLFSGASAWLPSAGRWMGWIKRAGGVIMLGMAGYYLWQAWQVWR